MGIEAVEYNGTRYAEIIWANERVEKTRFFSPAESSFQFGLLAHDSGYVEDPHYHRPFSRTVDDLQQMFVMQFGIVDVDLYSDDGDLLRTIRLQAGDAIVLIHGVHAIRVIEKFQALSVKQGPFMGDAYDKVIVKVKP